MDIIGDLHYESHTYLFRILPGILLTISVVLLRGPGGGSSESEGECGGGGGAGGGACRARAQYVSANCVVFTHYSGDVATVVDEHFARALALDKHKGEQIILTFCMQ